MYWVDQLQAVGRFHPHCALHHAAAQVEAAHATLLAQLDRWTLVRTPTTRFLQESLVLNAYFIRNLDDALQGRIFSLVYMTRLVNAPHGKRSKAFNLPFENAYNT